MSGEPTTVLGEMAALSARQSGDNAGPWGVGVVAGIEASRSLLGSGVTLLKERHARALSEHERDFAAGVAFAIRLLGGAS